MPRKSAPWFAALTTIVLVACSKKEDVPASVPDAAPLVVLPTATALVDAGSGLLSDPTVATTATVPKPTVAQKAGETTGDAGPLDAGAPQQCCCEAKGHPLATVVQSECSTTRKGQCVKKEKCAEADAKAAKDALAKSCCCDAGGKKEIAEMSACTKTKKGQCVKMTQCQK